MSRREHRTNTLSALGTAALDLFEARGASVTIDEIAAAAGVSRRTVFRYVDSKESLAFVQPMLWFDVFDDALAAHDLEYPRAPAVDRLHQCSRAIALHIDEHADLTRRGFVVAALIPELTRGFSGVFQQWVDRVASEVVDGLGGPDDPDVRFRSRIIGAAVMGMVDAVTREWVGSDPSVRFVDLYDKGFEMIKPLFETAASGGE